MQDILCKKRKESYAMAFISKGVYMKASRFFMKSIRFIFLFCLASNLYADSTSIKAILTDIEGTTTSISFVHDILFPYAKKNVGQFLQDNQHSPAVAEIISEVKVIADEPQADLDQVTAILLDWMLKDKKITSLKTLQGMMWKEGYAQGAFQGHVYVDAYENLLNWKDQGIDLYVFSSGSVSAQKLLFSHSTFGDLTPLFSGYFDTRTGAKKEKTSYESIALQIGVPAQDVLFLSDTIEELVAAKAAGMHTILLCRDSACPDIAGFTCVNTFQAISLP